MSELPFVQSALRGARVDIESRGGRYGVVFVPAKLSVLHLYCRWPASSDLRNPAHGESPFRAALLEFCAREGIPAFDLTDALRAVAQEGELPYFAADTHLNSRGHEAMAQALATWVRSLRSRAGGA